MATKRMTGEDFHKELKSLEASMTSLDAHVRSRLLELVKKYPDAPITSDAKGKHMTQKWLNGLMTGTVIHVIEKIEKWSADQQKIEQLYLDMPDGIKETLEKLSD
jgi:hypothetical protein